MRIFSIKSKNFTAEFAEFADKLNFYHCDLCGLCGEISK